MGYIDHLAGHIDMEIYREVLVLNVRKQYFEEIKSGKKKEEYRRYTDYWRTRLEGVTFDRVSIRCGYPATTDTNRVITRPFRGMEVKTIQHPHFGEKPVKVFAIKVNE